MPLLKIQTNVTLPADAAASFVAQASRAVAELLRKPESYVMVALEAGATMAFAGSAAPLAYLELKSIGLPQPRTGAFSRALCELVGAGLGIPAERIYIEFTDAEGALWGWNGTTF